MSTELWPAYDRYDFAPGLWNKVRVWIRRRVTFSTYNFRVAPYIGWPKVVMRDGLGEDVTPDVRP